MGASRRFPVGNSLRQLQLLDQQLLGRCGSGIGGALMIGAVPRVRKSQRLRDVVTPGVGLAVLADSRPHPRLRHSREHLCRRIQVNLPPGG